MRLYEIPTEFQAIQDELERSLGEVTPEIETRFRNLLEGGKAKLEAACHVKRNLEVHEGLAKAQAEVFKAEAERCLGQAKSFGACADRLGEVMAPALKAIGTIKTVAGSFYATRRVTYAISLRPGADIKALDRKYWRQADPELNKKPLQDLAKQHPLTPGQMEFVLGGDFKKKDIERIQHDHACTDADLDVLVKDNLTQEQRLLLAGIRGHSALPDEVVAVPFESLTTACRAAAEPVEVQAAPATTQVAPAIVQAPPPAPAEPVPLAYTSDPLGDL